MHSCVKSTYSDRCNNNDKIGAGLRLRRIWIHFIFPLNNLKSPLVNMASFSQDHLDIDLDLASATDAMGDRNVYGSGEESKGGLNCDFYDYLIISSFNILF